MSNSGAVTKDLGQFKTLPPDSNSPFSSVSVLTHGFTLLPNQSGIPDSFFQMANKIATVSGNTPENSGLIMRYDKPTGNWIPIDLQGRVITNLTGGLNTSEPNYLSTLANNLKSGVVIDGKEIKYLNQNKPLVLLTEWSLDRESVIPDVGFSEGAADALFASMVQLDLALGGKVGEYEGNQLKRLYDSQGKLIRTQGELFNSPMHFMGFSRGTVVNSEIVQRLGTFFPQAGGKSMADRDLQMTTIDPHDFYQPSLNLRLPGFISTNFSDFYEPKVQVWNNVTFADNYYQTVADPIGFTKDDVIAGTHKRAFGWYAGTVDLDLEEVLLQYPHVEASEKPQAVNDMLGKMGLPEMFDPNFPAAKPWYDNGNGEGVSEGWFYSVLGGGKEQRKYSPTGRVPVSFDNTLSAGMRGDYAVPTLFNGNFDQYIPNKSAPENLGRNAISKEIPGWSFHNNSPQVAQASTSNSPNTENLVDWSQIDTLKDYIPNQRNYALKLEAGSSITHNRFVVPDWGSLRLDLHAPGVTNNFTVKPKGTLDVTIRPLDSSIPAFSQTITLQKAQNGTDGGAPSTYLEDKYKVDYGRTGFESFYIDVPERLRGQAATVDFKDSASIPVYLDNVFFQSDSLKFGNPNRARTDLNNTYQTNYLIEKPQYTLSYNGQTNTPNWVGWVLDKGWANGTAGRAAESFAEDSELPASSFYMVQHDDYDFKSQIGYDKNDEYGRFLWNKKAFFWADRGHLTPSADRQRSKKDNIATFLTTNIIPQDSKQNSGIWATQEAELRKLAKNRDFKFFLFAGGSGEGGGTVTYGPLPTEVKGPKPIQIGDSNPNQFANFTAGTDSDNQAMIQVPDALWKVVLGFSPENKSEIPDIHFAWWIPNNSYSIKETLDYTKPTQYSDGLIGPTFENRAWNDGAFTMSIKALEARLNKDLPLDSQYDFLSNIDDPAVKENLRSVQRLLPQ